MVRNDLVKLLMADKLTRLTARAVVDVVFESINEALQAGETVHLPIGTFEVAEHSRRPTRTWALNRVRVTYKQRKYIKFTCVDLGDASNV